HVGDSRIYLYWDSPAHTTHANSGAHTGNTTIPEQEQTTSLTRLTEDHSLVGKLLKDGFITEEEARNHPKRNVLYQSIGLKREIDIQTTGTIPIQTGQKYLLCSDGLYGVVPDHEIKEYLKVNSTAAIAEQLVQRAKTNGGPDNITVIVVSTEKDETPGLTDTVKIITPPLKKRKKRKAWLFILLGLLVLLLAVMIYLLVLSADVSASASPSPGKRQTVITSSPKPQDPGRSIIGQDKGSIK
ncbi:MAG: serine/threonine-protein phosphatase, partial [Candidatus Aminicenantes bacterium]